MRETRGCSPRPARRAQALQPASSASVMAVPRGVPRRARTRQGIHASRYSRVGYPQPAGVPRDAAGCRSAVAVGSSACLPPVIVPLELLPVAEYHVPMLNRLIRAFVLLVAFVALQASVLGAAGACVVGGEHGAAGASSMDPRHGAALPVDAAASVPAPDPRSASNPSSSLAAVTGGEAPCEHDAALQRCAAVQACVVFVDASVRRPDEPGVPIAHAVPPHAALAPDSPALPPEPPPPRV